MRKPVRTASANYSCPPQEERVPTGEGFSNLSAIDSLTESQLKDLEKRLLVDIVVGDIEGVDNLVVDTLVYLNSKEAVLSFEKLLENDKIGNYSKFLLIIVSRRGL